MVTGIATAGWGDDVGPSETIDTLFAANIEYVPHVWTVMASVVRNTHNPIRGFVMSDRALPPEHIAAFASTLPQVSFHWKAIDEFDTLLHGIAPWAPRAHAITFARIFGPDAVPEDCRRLIYVDSDVIVRADVNDLWSTDIGDFPIAAVQDVGCPWIGTPKLGLPDHRTLGIDAASPYFNSGVLVIDIKRWRTGGYQARLLEYLTTAKIIHFADQDAFNAVFHDNWHHLHPTWNYLANGNIVDHSSVLFGTAMADEVAKDPAFVHFAGQPKPWAQLGNPRQIVRYVDEWEAIFRSGPYAHLLDHMSPSVRIKRSIGRNPLLRRAWYLKKNLRRLADGSL